VPYSDTTILVLWASAIEQGFTAPIWMTLKQALELDAYVRKGRESRQVLPLNQDFGGNIMATNGYAREEFVTERGAHSFS
jgi:antirestriction protein ArdC